MHSYFKKIVGLFFGTLFSLTAFMSVNYFKNEESISDSFTPALAVANVPSSSYDIRGGVNIYPLHEKDPDSSYNYGYIDIMGRATGEGNENWGTSSDKLYIRIKNRSSQLVNGNSVTCAVSFRVWFDDLQADNYNVCPKLNDVKYYNASGTKTADTSSASESAPGNISVPAGFNGFLEFDYTKFCNVDNAGQGPGTFQFNHMYKMTLVLNTKSYSNLHITIGDIFTTSTVVYDFSNLSYARWQTVVGYGNAKGSSYWYINRAPLVHGGFYGGIQSVITASESGTDATPFADATFSGDTSSGIYFYLKIFSATENSIVITMTDNDGNRYSTKHGVPIYLLYNDGNDDKFYVHDFHTSSGFEVPGYIQFPSGFEGFVYIPYPALCNRWGGSSTFNTSRITKVGVGTSDFYNSMNVILGDVRTVSDIDLYVGTEYTTAQFASHATRTKNTNVMTQFYGFKGSTATETKYTAYVKLIDQDGFTHSNNGDPFIRIFDLTYSSDAYYSSGFDDCTTWVNSSDMISFYKENGVTKGIDIRMTYVSGDDGQTKTWETNIPWFIVKFSYIYLTKTQTHYGKRWDGGSSSDMVLNNYASTGVTCTDYANRWDGGEAKIWHDSNVSYNHSSSVTFYPLTVEAGSGGTVSPAGFYSYGQYAKLNLVATPSDGSQFSQWSDGNTNATRSVFVTAGGNFKATFVDATYTMTYNKNDAGASSATTTGTKTHNIGYEVLDISDLGWTASAGRKFLKWNTQSNGDGTDYEPGKWYFENSNETFYSIQDWYTYQYCINNGSWVDMSRTDAAGYVCQFQSASIPLHTGDTISYRRYYGSESEAESVGGTVTYADWCNYNTSTGKVMFNTTGVIYMRMDSDGNYNVFVDGYNTRSIAVIHNGVESNYATYESSGQWVSYVEITIQSGDIVKGRYQYGSAYNVTINGYSSGTWSYNASGEAVCQTSGVYRAYMQHPDGDYINYNILYFSMSGEASAIDFAQKFNTSVGAVCTTIVARTGNLDDLIEVWGETNEAGLYHFFSTLSNDAKNYLVPTSGNSDIQAFFIKYTYVINKYSDDLPDFLGDLNTLSAPKVTGKATLFETENENKQLTTIIIIVASLNSIAAISTLTLLAFKKGKNTKK